MDFQLLARTSSSLSATRTDINNSRTNHGHNINLNAKIHAQIRWKLRLLNIIGISYCMSYSLITFLVGMTVTLPNMYRLKSQTLWERQLLAGYFFTMLVLNYLFIGLSQRRSRVGPSTASLPLFDPDLHRWKYCSTCSQYTPPRAQHCPLCQCCILKRDHHCFFAGTCIGFHNQRYFIVFCFYGFLSATFALMATSHYLELYYAHMWSKDFYQYLLPWVVWRWWSGVNDIWMVLMVLHGYLSCVTLLGCGFYFLCQILLVLSGQSTYEFWKGIQIYRQSLPANLKSIFGPFWIMNFVFPCPWFRNKGNGIDWILSTDIKNN